MTTHDRTEIAREIAEMLPDKKRWWILRSVAIGVVTALCTTGTVTWSLSNQYNRLWNAVNDNTRQNQQHAQQIDKLQDDVERQKERLLICCPSVFNNSSLITKK